MRHSCFRIETGLIRDCFGLLSRAVTPLIDFRCSRWPPQKQIATELDRTQRKMTATLLCVPRSPGEFIDDYVWRRGRISAKLCREHGLWSDRWFNRAIKWESHLSRDRNIQCWAARLRTFRDRAWFMERRSQLAPQDGASSSIHAGRTDTRSFPGVVHMHWHDGVELAKARLE